MLRNIARYLSPNLGFEKNYTLVDSVAWMENRYFEANKNS